MLRRGRTWFDAIGSEFPMSCGFEIDDETVWSPSLRVGDLYARLHGVGSV